ncbi:Glutaminyl-peptide cyclotransferase [Planctomycetales bacterium 10988]|nr:Glutaminyl-peptide cyclotransferase [Planctomycetales bacterium 10988]
MFLQRHRWWIFGTVFLGILGFLVWWPTMGPSAEMLQAPTWYACRVVNTYPHDPQAFTQGLVYDDGELLESTGLYGESSLRRVELKTGKVLQQINISSTYFAEGITLWDGQIVQLTWRNRQGFLFDADSFKQTDQFRYAGEGWGLTHDGLHWIMSDGSNILRFIDPETREVVRKLPVFDRRFPVKELNELEYIDGEIYANLWHRDRIARISPESGQVTGWIDLRNLLPAHLRPNPEAIPNGIAYDPEEDRLFLTGKNWPKLYEVQLIRQRN